MKRILIIEDTDTIREELTKLLARYGYDVLAPTDFENILEYVKENNADLILLDINLPYFDGYHICREIRKDSNVPIIIVTSRDSDMDEIMSMNLGADDFITKPYNTQVLLARIGSILRRTYSLAEQEVLTYGDLKLNLSNGTISCNGKEEELTKNELKILACLLKSKGNVVSREDLMDYMWNSDIFVDDNTLSVNVTRLRKKLEEVGMKGAIETRRGLGYIMP
ncbi:response regulator transcription factor [Clostridium sp. B9]|uniref:response regulator transcription factor n=1 Tax=Clostridium sp. B9 TaxID=3423224 RepID=UPI003D2F390E